jgi:hypothetical protein
MTARVLLFATVNLAMNTGVNAQTVVTAPEFKTDTCTPTKGCSQPYYPNHGSICVEPQTGVTQCWNACDPARTDLNSYSGVQGNGNPASTTAAERAGDVEIRQAIAMMVQSARTVQGLCPGAEWNTNVECNLNTRCTAYTLNRGFCSIGANGAHVCKDMCDSSIPIDQYGGTAGIATNKADVEHTVSLVRANRDPLGETICPGATVWLWLWFPIVLCCIIGCCYGGYVAYNHWRRVNRNKNRLNQREQEYDYDREPAYDDYPQDQEMLPPQDFPQDFGPEDPQYMPVQGDEPPLATREPEKDLMDVVAPPVAPPPPGAPPQRGSFQPPGTAFAPPGMAAPSTFYNSQRGSFQPPMTQYPGQPGSFRPV